jgi:hypothetical protein
MDRQAMPNDGKIRTRSIGRETSGRGEFERISARARARTIVSEGGFEGA